MRILSTLLRYNGAGGCESVCGLRVFERQGRYPRTRDEDMKAQGLPPQPSARVVIFTELPQNPGTSITNRMQHLALETFYNYPLMGFSPSVDRLHLPLFQTIFVDHYPPDLQMAQDYNQDIYKDDRFSIVNFRFLEWSNTLGAHIPVEPQSWDPITKAELEAMIGESWDLQERFPGEMMGTGTAKQQAHALLVQFNERMEEIFEAAHYARTMKVRHASDQHAKNTLIDGIRRMERERTAIYNEMMATPEGCAYFAMDFVLPSEFDEQGELSVANS